MLRSYTRRIERVWLGQSVDRKPLIRLHFACPPSGASSSRHALLAALAPPAHAEIPVVELDGVVHAVSAGHVVRAIDRADAAGRAAPRPAPRHAGRPRHLDAPDRRQDAELPHAGGGVRRAVGRARGLRGLRRSRSPPTWRPWRPARTSAPPIPVSGMGQMDEVMSKKVTSDAAAYIRSKAERRGRNVEMAEKAVVESRSFTEKEALETQAHRPRGQGRARPPAERSMGARSSASTAASCRLSLAGEQHDRGDDELAAAGPVRDRPSRGAVPAPAGRAGRPRDGDQPSRAPLPGHPGHHLPDPLPVRDPDHSRERGGGAARPARGRPVRGGGEGRVLRALDRGGARRHDPRRDDARGRAVPELRVIPGRCCRRWSSWPPARSCSCGWSVEAQRGGPARARRASSASAGVAATALEPEGWVHVPGERWRARRRRAGRTRASGSTVVAVEGLRLRVRKGA